MLNTDQNARFTMDDVKNSNWFRIENPLLDPDGMCSDPIALAERMKSKLLDIVDEPDEAIAYSQPAELRMIDSGESVGDVMESRITSFSQPMSRFIEDSGSNDFNLPMESVSELVSNLEYSNRSSGIIC